MESEGPKQIYLNNSFNDILFAQGINTRNIVAEEGDAPKLSLITDKQDTTRQWEAQTLTHETWTHDDGDHRRAVNHTRV